MNGCGPGPGTWHAKLAPSGHQYYYNDYTGESSWVLPEGVVSACDWVEMTAPSGHCYYYNVRSRQSSWVPPSPVPTQTSPPLAPAAPPSSAPAQSWMRSLFSRPSQRDVPPPPPPVSLVASQSSSSTPHADSSVPPPPPRMASPPPVAGTASYGHDVSARRTVDSLPPVAEADGLPCGSIAGKIDNMLAQLPRRCTSPYSIEIFTPAALRPWLHRGGLKPGRPLGNYFFGIVVYGFLTIPFIFALLQQTMIDGKAVDPYASDDKVSKRAWFGGAVFLGAASLYCMLIFTVLEEEVWYVAGSTRLSLLLLSMVCMVLYQQILTLRYIALRPELSTLMKRENKRYYRLCGKAYTSMNPRNPINYLLLSVIVAEFFAFVAVVFHPRIPWMQQGARDEDRITVTFLQNVLPQFLAGNIYTVEITVLLAIVLSYVLFIGEFVTSDRRQGDPMAAVLVEFLSTTCYTTVVARLFGLAGDIRVYTSPPIRMATMLAFFIFSTTATYLVTLKGAPDLYSDKADIKYLPLFLVVSNMLKGLLGISATIMGNHGAPRPLKPDSTLAPSPPSAPLPPAVPLSEREVRGGPLAFVLFALAVLVVHLVIMLRWRVCSVSFVTRVRMNLLCVAAFGLLIATLMLLIPWEGWFLLLIISWSLIAGAVAAYGFHRVFYAEPPEENDDVKQQRVRDLASNLIRHGANRKSLTHRITDCVLGENRRTSV
ncbi:hypothetical protein AB1Y20_004339 [Prymnesium parvum]|uniref:WW domain-containing protein n=1 Tax=Prymnesium parvum TaxID=97485 RepID=A0AB34IW24_PRYPA